MHFVDGIVLDLKTTSLLNKAIQRKIPQISIFRKTTRVTIDLESNIQIDHGSKDKKSELKRHYLPAIWYYRSSDGTIQAYEHEVNIRICIDVSTGKTKKPLKLSIRKQLHELDIENRTDYNLETKEGLQMFSDEEILKKFQWLPVVDVSNLTETKTDVLNHGSEEYSKVADFFFMSMPRRAKGVNEDLTQIIKIEKILNPQLRRNWEHELENVMLANESSDINLNTKMLFHGTGATDPKVIYEAEKGFLINFASDDGLWGRGVYFAQDAVYSHKYTYRTNQNTRKMIVAQVITGDGINLDEDRNIRLPPEKDGKRRYDCVIGMRHGTFIYVCYDNGRAYPAYLIEYKSREL